MCGTLLHNAFTRPNNLQAQHFKKITARKTVTAKISAIVTSHHYCDIKMMNNIRPR